MRSRFLIPMIISTSFLFVGLMTNGFGSGTGDCDCPGPEKVCTDGNETFCGTNQFCDGCGCVVTGFGLQCVLF